eukprot:TRINITY_DN28571_c0_g1_i1.p1 TRINITY_DN28571_c0_g1~~TRINITY_DN28571_c0_g1_i1.p1  ORF type:complete len:346 (-),score=84.46 TRINITY_DN28571_c0_g1_i1:419-1408(-)
MSCQSLLALSGLPRLALSLMLFLDAVNSTTLSQLQAAAAGGSPVAQTQLGLEYLYGSTRTTRQPREAAHWLDVAASGGSTEAMVQLAKLLRGSSDVVDRDLQRSLALATKAAKLGDAEAMDLVAEAYFNDLGVEKMPDKKRMKEAVRWLKKAAGAGAFRAQVQLADAYREGKLLERDGSKAVKWYRKAARRADDLNATSARTVSEQAAQMIQKVHLTLAVMAYQGHGMKKNLTTAMTHLGRTLDLGYEPARQAMVRLQKEHKKWLKKQEILNDPEIEELLKKPFVPPEGESPISMDKMEELLSRSKSTSALDSLMQMLTTEDSAEEVDL